MGKRRPFRGERRQICGRGVLKSNFLWNLIAAMVKKTSWKKLLQAVRSRQAFHAYLWFAFFLLVLLTVSPKEDPQSLRLRAGEALEVILLTLPPVYLHFLALDRFFYRRKYAAYAMVLPAIVVGYAYLAQFLSAAVMQRRSNATAGMVIIGFLILVSSAIKALADLSRQRLLLQELRARQAQIELDLLRSQVHPHFLFNTLNNLFGLARRRDPAAADGIVRLSGLMRYMIYDSTVDRIELTKEIDQIHRLIELERLRFAPEDDVRIEFQIRGEPGGTTVPPMLLLPFVENAFKHGVRATASSFVRIHLAIEPVQITFCVENSVHEPTGAGKGITSGRGLENVRRRLELLFPGSHRLDIEETGELFSVRLFLQDTPVRNTA